MAGSATLWLGGIALLAIGYSRARGPGTLVVTVTTDRCGSRASARLYGLGRPLREIIPYVPIASTVRTGVSILSYRDRVAFGVTGDYDSASDVDVLARLNLAQIELAFDPDRYPPAQFSPVRVNRVFDEHFLLGVATLKGHRLFNKYQHITEEE